MTWLLTLWPKAKLYALITIAALVAGAAVFAGIRKSGAQSEKLKQLQSNLERKRIEYDVAATNAAVDASVRRKRLRERWTKR